MESSLKKTKVITYNPNKDEREARRHIWERYTAMTADPSRKEAEAEWEEADKMFRMWTPDKDPQDWRSLLVLPDGFAAIQADMQERIERKSRPVLQGGEESDAARVAYCNAILNFNMDKTSFDYQTFLAKYAAAIRGTSWVMDYYRVDKRKIKDAVDVDEEGNIKYQEKEQIDYDDDYLQWIPNEYVFIDETVDHIDKARDCIIREILPTKEFKRKYGFKKDFKNIDKVQSGGDTHSPTFFRMPKDMTDGDVEILHYYNRAEDCYDVLVNSIVVRQGPIPFKHKELPLAQYNHYTIPGRLYGFGIPKVIRFLTEERRAIRMLNLDRQKMQLNKMFLVNKMYDIDEEDLVTRPHGFIGVDSQGAPLNNVIQPIEYGDVPGSYRYTEDILLEDIKRAHGIDDRMQGVNQGGTATEAAIMKEESQKRINMISHISEMDTYVRIGRLKWSNIQFFYPGARLERQMSDEGEEKEKRTFRTINVKGQEFTIKKSDDGKGDELVVNEISGESNFKLDKKMAKFIEGGYDVVIDPDSTVVISKVLQQAKISEMINTITANPLMQGQLDAKKAFQRYVEANGESADRWQKTGMDDENQAKEIAEMENMVMSDGITLAPTEDASEAHTAEHINFTKTAEYQALPDSVKAVLDFHIQGEIDANQNVGSFAGMAQSAGVPKGPMPGGMPGGIGQGMEPGPMDMAPMEGQAPVSAPPA